MEGTVRKSIVAAVAVVTFAVVGLAGMGAAQAAPSSQDTTFLKSNEQVNLAEQAIGTIAEQRSQNSQTMALAKMTISDHKTAEAKNKSVSSALKVVLPTAPNATQQAQAAQLKSVAASSFDLTYVQIQVAGHQMSIADTQKEISSGSDPSVIAYAKGYLPVAQMHLKMAQDELAALGGNPSSVNAGTGGLVATGGTSHTWEWGVLAAGLLVAGGGAALLLSRRRVSDS
jgi:putative membrane protein